MKPNDQNAGLPTTRRPFRILIISGSERRQYNCPGVDSKSRTLMLRMAAQLPQDWEIDYEDIGNVYGREKIQSCNACVSTSMALCVWPCNCYAKNDSKEPDLMWNMDLYARLDMADAWAIIGPINWYGPSSNLKLLFDRLVCMNGGNPDEKSIGHKNPEKAMALEKTEQWKKMSVNHLEGRTAAFFCYGDGGGDELDEQGIPKILLHKQYFNPADEPYGNDREAYQSLVWQCRYGGVEVPDRLWQYGLTGEGKKYSDNQAEHMVLELPFLQQFDRWVQEFAGFVGQKGKIEPGRYRAYGFKAPGHFLANIRDGIRYLKLMAGRAPENSSPREQEEQSLNQDTGLHPKKSEGEKLRDQ